MTLIKFLLNKNILMQLSLVVIHIIHLILFDYNLFFPLIVWEVPFFFMILMILMFGLL